MSGTSITIRSEHVSALAWTIQDIVRRYGYDRDRVEAAIIAAGDPVAQKPADSGDDGLKACPWGCEREPETQTHNDTARCRYHTGWMTRAEWNRRVASPEPEVTRGE